MDHLGRSRFVLALENLWGAGLRGCVGPLPAQAFATRPRRRKTQPRTNRTPEIAGTRVAGSGTADEV